MNARAKLLLCFLLMTYWSSGTQKPQKSTENLLFPPSTFTHVPNHVRQQLEEMRCHIFKKNNLVEGNFAAAHQDDWAALCVNDGKIQPVVIWRGQTRCDFRPAPAKDFAGRQFSGQRSRNRDCGRSLRAVLVTKTAPLCT
jgi:hypothetical protein